MNPLAVIEAALWQEGSMAAARIAEQALDALRDAGWLLVSKPEKTEAREPAYGGLHLQMRGMADGQVLASQKVLHPVYLDSGRPGIVEHVWQYVGREYAHELARIVGCYS